MKYVALLRGVSPASAPNTKLIALFEKLGFTDIQTVGSSGNILFVAEATDTAKLEIKIEQGLRTILGANALAIVRSIEQIKSLVERKPFGNHAHTSTTYLAVTFLKQALANTANDRYAAYYDPHLHAVCTVNDNTARPHFMTILEREYGKNNTTRTWNMILKITDKSDV